MAAFNYQTLKKKYENFAHPILHIELNGKDFSKNKEKLQISDIEVEMTSGTATTGKAVNFALMY